MSTCIVFCIFLCCVCVCCIQYVYVTFVAIVVVVVVVVVVVGCFRDGGGSVVVVTSTICFYCAW